MENIKDIVRNFQKPPKQQKRTTERGEVIKYFQEGVNAERDGKKYRKLPFGYFAMKLTGLKQPDLYYLKSVCDDARRRGQSFAKTFFGSLRAKPEQS